MKKFVLLIILLLGIKGFSQHPELFDTEWLLHKVVINGDDIIPPHIPLEPEVGKLILDEVSFFYEYCDFGVMTEIIYDADSIFEINENDWVITGTCTNPDYYAFEIILYSVFYNNEIPINPFSYTVTSDSNGNKLLIIINANGDEAHYGSVPLSQPEFSQPQLTLYPNPVKDVLQINSTEIISEVSVYDIHGKEVKTVSMLNSNSSEIDLSSLQNGVYFITVLAENGAKLTRKVVKKK